MEIQTDRRPTADVIVIGGGLIGCSIAFRLAQAHLRVMVVDRGEPGAEASSAAAGMLAPQGETVEPNPFFEICAASRDLYPSFVAEVEELSGQNVDYRRNGTLLVALNQDECRELEEIYNAQSRLGLELDRISAGEARERVPSLSPEVQCGVFIPGDHWVDNERLCSALVSACRSLGVIFQIGSPVRKLTARQARVESIEIGPEASGGNSTLSAAAFVLAAGCWSGDLAAMLGIPLRTQPCRGQMIEFDAPTDLSLVVRSGHYYLVPRFPSRVIAGTTVEYVGYERAVTGEGLRSILEGVTRLIPALKNFRFRRAWAGLRPDTADHLPILGHGPLANLIFATGHFRNGILLAPLTAQWIAEIVQKGSTPQALKAYDPKRFAQSETAEAMQ